MKNETNQYFERMAKELDGQVVNFGISKAFGAWRDTNYYNLIATHLEVRDLPEVKYMNDFVRVLKEAKVERFVLLDRSTALMEGLHALGECGVEIEGLAEVPVKDKWTGEITIAKGIWMCMK